MRPLLSSPRIPWPWASVSAVSCFLLLFLLFSSSLFLLYVVFFFSFFLNLFDFGSGVVPSCLCIFFFSGLAPWIANLASHACRVAVYVEHELGAPLCVALYVEHELLHMSCRVALYVEHELSKLG